MEYLRITDWEELQHYKNRLPSWIKWHRELLADYTFAMLSVEAKAVYPLLCLIAAENKAGLVKYNIKEIAFKISVSPDIVESAIQELLDASKVLATCYQDASNMLAECYQSASTEESREEERQRKVEKISFEDELDG